MASAISRRVEARDSRSIVSGERPIFDPPSSIAHSPGGEMRAQVGKSTLRLRQNVAQFLDRAAEGPFVRFGDGHMPLAGQRAQPPGFRIAGNGSGAMRLRADGIEVTADFRNGISYEEWFLAGPDDIRASSALEVAATEFECQALRERGDERK